MWAQGGRPGLYDPEAHCKLVIDVMMAGGSIAAVCAKIGIGRSLLHEWRKKYPEFNEAIELGKELAQNYWEIFAQGIGTGRAHTDKDFAKYKKANPKMIQFILARRFSDYYQKTRNLNEEIGGKNNDDLRLLSSEERRALIERYRVLIDKIEEGLDDDDNSERVD